MKILHIAKISNKRLSGVKVVVPQHILAQSKYEEVYFYNLNDDKIKELNDFQIYCNFSDNLINEIIDKIGNIDLVIIHEVNNIQNIVLYKQLLMNKIPYVIIPHGELCYQALSHRWLKKKVAYFLFFNRFLRKANALQCLSDGEKRDIKIKTAKRIIVGNGIEFNGIVKDSFSEDAVKFLYIGRLDPRQKGLDLLITAIKQMEDELRTKKVTFDLYGPFLNSFDVQVKKLIVDNKVEDLVSLNEAIYSEEKTKQYLLHDLFIQTSRHEGLPAGILEAMSYGLPCVLTEGTNMSHEIIDNDAGYYAGNDVNSIKKAIREAISDRSNWANKGRNSIKVIKENYLWDKIATKELNEYKNILK